MTKRDCEERLNTILEESGKDCGVYHREIVMNDWANYGKSRTYFSIVETCNSSKHYVKRDYGYFDNISNTYVPGKNDLNENYTFSGAKF